MVWLDKSGLGDDPPAIHYIFNSPFDIILDLQVLRRLTLNVFEFAELF